MRVTHSWQELACDIKGVEIGERKEVCLYSACSPNFQMNDGKCSHIQWGVVMIEIDRVLLYSNIQDIKKLIECSLENETATNLKGEMKISMFTQKREKLHQYIALNFRYIAPYETVLAPSPISIRNIN